MQKGEQPNRWVMKYFPGEGEENSASSRPVNMRRRFQTVDHSVPDEDSIRRNEDQEEIDFDEEFADDEEAPIMDGNEEDVKEVEKKILVCTDQGDCTEEELRVKVQEIVSHEFLHAYLNEAGVDLTDGDEEKLCDFYMKNWRKLNNSILEVLDKSGFLDN